MNTIIFYFGEIFAIICFSGLFLIGGLICFFILRAWYDLFRIIINFIKGDEEFKI